MQQEEIKIDGITFIREQDNEQGNSDNDDTYWKVVESVTWEERHEDAGKYGTVRWNLAFGCYVFQANILCPYPIGDSVLQVIVTFMHQLTGRDIATHRLTSLGL